MAVKSNRGFLREECGSVYRRSPSLPRCWFLMRRLKAQQQHPGRELPITQAVTIQAHDARWSSAGSGPSKGQIACFVLVWDSRTDRICVARALRLAPPHFEGAAMEAEDRNRGMRDTRRGSRRRRTIPRAIAVRQRSVASTGRNDGPSGSGCGTAGRPRAWPSGGG